MRVLVYGSTNFNDKELIYKTLDDIHHTRQIDVIITNDSHGANNFAWKWSLDREVYGIFYCTEEKKYGSTATRVRNERMLAEGNPDLVVNFLGGIEVEDIIDKAKNAGKEIVNIEYEEV